MGGDYGESMDGAYFPGSYVEVVAKVIQFRYGFLHTNVQNGIFAVSRMNSCLEKEWRGDKNQILVGKQTKNI